MATATTSRLTTLDAVRGLAVMGILILNIVDFGMPGYAYVDPNFYGGATGANWWSWAINYVLFDGKMRGLFTMMFGASTVLIAEQAEHKGESPARVHYARMFWLFVLGMIHAYLIWYGDILVLYSVAGAIAFAAWRWRPATLFKIGIGLLLLKLLIATGTHIGAVQYRTAASLPGASADTVQGWQEFRESLAPSPEEVPQELAAYRGNYRDNLEARIPTTWYFQTFLDMQALPDTLALIAIGMALFKTGFFSGDWSRRRYRQTIVGGAVAALLYVPIVAWIDATDFSPVTLLATDGIHLALLRPWMSIGFASIVILFVRSGSARWLADRLAAAGQMAFSNYLGTSILCTTFFYGFGFGWYGYFERWQLWFVVIAVWALILLWSKPWLSHFYYGPFEWLWRSLARGRLQPMRR